MPKAKTTTETVKKAATAKPTIKEVKPKSSVLSVKVYSLVGTSSTQGSLPASLFGAKVNKNLLSQALRVYLTNQQSHWSNTKTRGEVEGSTRKLFKQKGTGRARHGAVRAPIFVGGGIALGPKTRRTQLKLPKKMKKAALISALSQKAVDQQVKVLDGVEKMTGKTKELASLLKKLETESALIVAEKSLSNLAHASRNIKALKTVDPNQLNLVEVMKYKSLVLTKQALEQLEKRLTLGNRKGQA